MYYSSDLIDDCLFTRLLPISHSVKNELSFYLIDKFCTMVFKDGCYIFHKIKPMIKRSHRKKIRLASPLLPTQFDIVGGNGFNIKC